MTQQLLFDPCVKLLFVYIILLRSAESQLVINVKNQGGDIVQETILSNATEDTITLEFQRPEGTLITQFIDFKSEVQIFRVLVLGEEERGQSQYQVLCFVTRLTKNNFISADAMSKLRQRNPGAVRQPEEDKGLELLEMDLSVELEKSSVISPYLPLLCDEAAHSTYVREIDLRNWASPKAVNRDIVSLTSSVKRFPPPKPVRCRENNHIWQSCQCRLEICVGWYPCSLKYCRGKDSSGKLISYRCGIRTCRKCRAFDFFVQQKQQCLWDE